MSWTERGLTSLQFRMSGVLGWLLPEHSRRLGHCFWPWLCRSRLSLGELCSSGLQNDTASREQKLGGCPSSQRARCPVARHLTKAAYTWKCLCVRPQFEGPPPSWWRRHGGDTLVSWSHCIYVPSSYLLIQPRIPTHRMLFSYSECAFPSQLTQSTNSFSDTPTSLSLR